MYKKILSLTALLSAVIMFTSCLGDDTELTYYDDTAITGFSVSSVVRYLTTTASDGETDSTYSTTYTASSHYFYIDQYSCEIYNPDSLPYGTDATKIVAGMTTKNSGTPIIVYKSEEGEDSLAYFSTSDSLDYTEPMTVRVYNNRGTAYRTYTIHVNVHQETGDEFNWNSSSVSALAAVGERKVVRFNGTMYIFAQSGDATVALREDGSSWTTLTTGLDDSAWSSVVVSDETLYTLSGGNVMQSADGYTWTTVAAQGQLVQLLGAVEGHLYALSTDGIATSTDNGATWTAQQLDDSSDYLPEEDVNMVWEQTSAGTNTYCLLIIGARDGETRVWRKVEDFGFNAQDQDWAYYSEDPYNQYTLPVMSGLQVFAYDDNFIATGGDLSVFYESQDQGITWIENECYALPDTFDASASSYGIAVDDSNTIYVSGAGQSALWKGRLSRTAWAENQTIFTE